MTHPTITRLRELEAKSRLANRPLNDRDIEFTFSFYTESRNALPTLLDVIEDALKHFHELEERGETRYTRQFAREAIADINEKLDALMPPESGDAKDGGE